MEAATMSQTLCFFDELLNQARRLQQAGQSCRATTTLTKLLNFPDLPAEVAAEAHARAGELHLKARRFRKARRHLRAALKLAPDSARLHHRLGYAFANDPRGDAERALRHFKRALELDPGQSRWRSEAGLLAVRLGLVDDGLVLLRQAFNKAPADALTLTKLVKGLCQAGKPNEALRLVREARFSSPRCGRTRKLEEDLMLAQVRRDQEQASADRRDEKAVILPFPAPQLPRTNGARYDGPQTLPGPHLARTNARIGRRVP
jgi:pentatricopeptide repeat protein